MADNSPSSGGTGDTIASDDIGGIKYQRVKLVAGLDGVNDGDGSATTPYPTGLAATPFFPSANNSSSANLAVGATFTGTIQANQNLPVISINVACDQPTKVTLYGSTDAAGLNQVNPVVIPFVTSVSGYPVNAAIPGNTNYYWVTVQNVGYATTTKCVIDVGSGWLFPVTPLGNAPSAINEVGGVAVSGSIPVTTTGTSAVSDKNMTELLNAVSSQAPDLDTPSLVDILNPLSPSYVPGQTGIVGPGGVPYAQDPETGGSISMPAVRNLTGYVAITGGPNAFHFDTGSYTNLSVSAYVGSGSAPSLVLEGYINGAWVAVTLSAVGAFPSITIGMSATALTQFNSPTYGLERMRIRAASVGNPVMLRVQLNNNAPPPGAVSASVGGVVNTPTTATTSITINSAASTNATSVKASAGTLYQCAATNNGAAVCFLKLYNKASAPTVGTDTPIIVVSIPANGIPVDIDLGALGYRFTTGIALALTNLIADSDATAIVAGQVKVIGSYT